MTEPVISIKSLSKSFGSNQVLKAVNAEIPEGEIIGLLGLNGSGKTTLIETVLGFSPPSAGSVEIFGKNSFAELDNATKQRIGFVPQSDELMQNISVKNYLALIAKFYTHWNVKLIQRLCDEWKIPLEQRTEKLSVGQKQKLAILTALGHEPELIVLDEPVASLDPVARRQFLKELVDIADDQKRTIIFSTHIVTDLERVANKVWLLKDGDIAVREELDVLKEHTVRVKLPPNTSIPDSFSTDSLIYHRNEQQTNILLFTQWTKERHQELEQLIGGALEPEYLSLEDIFLELLQ
jgi:ABC-2 type transport system ATP-binding protein